MRAIGSKVLCASVILILTVTLSACGSEVELAPELQAQLDEYENLIDTFEPKFRAVRGDTAKFSDVADSYSQRVQAWMSEWSTVAPNLSDEEGLTVLHENTLVFFGLAGSVELRF